jgi:hypothetical protein
VHRDNGVALQCEDRYVNPAAAPDYLAQDFTRRTPTQYLFEATALWRAQYAIEAARPTAQEARLLGIAEDEPCLVVVRRTFSREHAITLGRLVYPGRRYQLQGSSRHEPAHRPLGRGARAALAHGGGRTRELLVWPAPAAGGCGSAWPTSNATAPSRPFPACTALPGAQRRGRGAGAMPCPSRRTARPTPSTAPWPRTARCCRPHARPEPDGGRRPRPLWGAAQPWHASPGWRGLYTTQSTTLRAGAHTLALAPHPGLERRRARPWQIDPPARAWWLTLEHAA